MPAPYEGHCLCGAIKFELQAEPLTLYACHCTDCQRRSAGALRLSMWAERGKLKITEGSPEIRTSLLGSGRQRVSKACAICDTDLWTEPPEREGLAIVRPGTLVKGREFVPVAHLFVRSALAWLTIPKDVKQYQTKPEDLKELIRLWRESRPDLQSESHLKGAAPPPQ
jgi:hypothetical protein